MALHSLKQWMSALATLSLKEQCNLITFCMSGMHLPFVDGAVNDAHSSWDVHINWPGDEIDSEPTDKPGD